jgi:hypothetical protein
MSGRLDRTIVTGTIAVSVLVRSHEKLLRSRSILKPVASFMVISHIMDQCEYVTRNISAGDHIFVKMLRFCAHALPSFACSGVSSLLSISALRGATHCQSTNKFWPTIQRTPSQGKANSAKV